MLKTTLSKIRKAWALALASRGRGDIRAFPGKFQKLSVSVLKIAAKNTTTKRNKLEHCEKCKQLIDYIFGSSTNENKTDPISLPDKPSLEPETRTLGLISQGFGIGGDDEKGIRIPLENARLQATTKRQTEEELTQKIEEIDEPALVEAEKKKIDEFNNAPRVLGHIAKITIVDDDNRFIYEKMHGKTTTMNDEDKEANIDMRDKIDALVRRIESAQFEKLGIYTDEDKNKIGILKFATDDSAQNQNTESTEDANAQNSFDEMAKRCLDVPTNHIDECLLNEMKKYGVPPSGSGSSNIDKGMLDVRIMKKPRRPVEKTEIDLETRKFDRDPTSPELHPSLVQHPNLHGISGISVNTTLNTTDVDSLDKMALTSEREAETDSKPRPRYDPNRPLIDPFDKRSLANETDDYGYETLTITESNQQADAEEQPSTTEEVNLQTGEQQYPNQMPNQYFYPGYQNYMYYQNFNTHQRYWQNQNIKSKANSEEVPNDRKHEKGIESDESPGLTGAGNPLPAQQNQQNNLTGNQAGQHPAQFGPWQHNVLWPEQGLQETQLQKPPKIIHPELISSDWNPEPDTHVAATPAAPKAATDANEKPKLIPVDPTSASICSLPQPKEIPESVTSKPDFKVYKDKVSGNVAQSEAVVTPLTDHEIPDDKRKNEKADSEALPKLNDESLPLSELLKRVRMRSRMQCCKLKQSPFAKKCSPPAPCPPPPPVCSPPPPAPCPPKIVPCPRPCKPKCPRPCLPKTPTCPPQPPTCSSDKFMSTFAGMSSHSFYIFTLLLCISQKFPEVPSPNNIEECVVSLSIKTGLPVENILEYFTNKFWSTYRAKLELFIEPHNESFEIAALAREFEPWVPIPSWPIPKKQKKKKLVCPKEGCKVIPPPRLDDPCDKSGNPCLGFPKRSN